MNRPRLIVTAETHRSEWEDLTWERRQGYRDRNGERVPLAQGEGMTTKELIAAMGSLHAHHPDFKEKPRSLLPMPNLAGRQPVMQGFDTGFFGQWRMILRAVFA